MDKKTKFDIGDDIFNPRRPAGQPERVGPDAFEEDTEAHVVRTYPKAVEDDELECRRPLDDESEERMRRI